MRYLYHSDMQRGVTLIEMLVVLAISAMLIVPVMDTIRMILRITTEQPIALQTIDQARTTATVFTNELRNATNGSDGSFALAEASTTEIIFFSPYRSGATTNVRRLRYFVASSTLYKGVLQASGSPPQYVLSNEQITPQVALSSTSTPVFSYYDGTFTGSSTPLAQPVAVTQVTYVQISLTVPQQDRRNATTTFTLTTGAAIRNLKTNLGN